MPGRQGQRHPLLLSPMSEPPRADTTEEGGGDPATDRAPPLNRKSLARLALNHVCSLWTTRR